jgi:hypothetical protein
VGRVRRKKSVKGPAVDPVVVTVVEITAEGEVAVATVMAPAHRASVGTTTIAIAMVSRAIGPVSVTASSPSRKKTKRMRPKRRNPHFFSVKLNPLAMEAVQAAWEMRAGEQRVNAQIPLASKPQMAHRGRKEWVSRRSSTVDMTGGEQRKVHIIEEKVFAALNNEGDKDHRWWVLDIGASNHMTGSRTSFANINAGTTGTIWFGDASVVWMEGRGTILYQCKSGEHCALTNVYYIPQLDTNILSVG